MERKIRTLATLNAPSFSARLDEVRLRNGEISKRIKMDHPEAAAVLAFVSPEKILMVRQYRYALGRETLEIPAGKVDPGENPEECARRELMEETGYGAGEVRLLTTYAPAIGYSNELIHIFSAHGLKKTRESIDEREISSIEILGLAEAKGLAERGEILDGKTLLALSMLKGGEVPGRIAATKRS
ncbi:MAG: NUDIX hydrolase [Deltaproteobacteria bacterium]|nr:NUDIX hydrolase [Deltaproteobacteria bacterium]